MVPNFAAILGAFTLAVSFAVSPVDATCARGLGWATNNQFAPIIGSKPLITWYHHWQDGPVPQMPSKDEFVPMFWGPSKWSQWSQRVSEMHKKTPKHLMSFNEPDIKTQAGMDPNYAAQLYMQQILPWASKGVKLGSPAIVWNLDWMNTFLNAVHQKGGHVDFMCLHWYGSWNDIASFKKFVQTAHSRFGMNIWVTELGITSASHPSQRQAKTFMMNAFTWMDSQPYVQRAAWFGSWESTNPPDYFSSKLNALLRSGGNLNDMGYWYGYTQNINKRSHSRHHLLERNETESAEDAIHCDEICVLRNEQLDSYLATLPASP